jgi:endonuclease/exonuclease/phosphatase family metal-dependent hydrolase
MRVVGCSEGAEQSAQSTPLLQRPGRVKTRAPGAKDCSPVSAAIESKLVPITCAALAARFGNRCRLLRVYVTQILARGGRARQYQVSQLLEWIRARDDAAGSIVCGDFNAAPDQPSMRLMSAAYRPTQTQPTAFTPLSEPGGAPTHPEWPRFDRCIDYIWVSASIKIQASGLCFNQPASDNPNLWPSDHVGVWADVEIG